MEKTGAEWNITPLCCISLPFFAFRSGFFHSAAVGQLSALVFSVSQWFFGLRCRFFHFAVVESHCAAVFYASRWFFQFRDGLLHFAADFRSPFEDHF
jgi:hypothetical protein